MTETLKQRSRNFSVVQSAQKGTCKHFFLHLWCSMAWNPSMAGPGGEGLTVMHMTKKRWIIKSMEKWNPTTANQSIPVIPAHSVLPTCTFCILTGNNSCCFIQLLWSWPLPAFSALLRAILPSDCSAFVLFILLWLINYVLRIFKQLTFIFFPSMERECLFDLRIPFSIVWI